MPEDDTRSFADDRRRLLGELELERNQLLRNIETCRIRDIERPMIDEWSLKDIIGHVASWEAEVVSALRDVQEGRRPAILDFEEERTDAWNQDHVERKRSLTFWSVLEQLKAGRDRLLAIVGEFDDAAIGEEGRVPNQLLQVVANHDREHWHVIAAYLAGMAGVRESTPAGGGS